MRAHGAERARPPARVAGAAERVLRWMGGCSARETLEGIANVGIDLVTPQERQLEWDRLSCRRWARSPTD